MSNEQKWTPGPWRKSQTDKGRPKIVDRNGFTVATAGAQPYNHDDFVLMSAAQDMFDALEQAVEAWKSEYGSCPTWWEDALAKANGGG